MHNIKCSAISSFRNQLSLVIVMRNSNFSRAHNKDVMKDDFRTMSRLDLPFFFHRLHQIINFESSSMYNLCTSNLVKGIYWIFPPYYKIHNSLFKRWISLILFVLYFKLIKTVTISKDKGFTVVDVLIMCTEKFWSRTRIGYRWKNPEEYSVLFVYIRRVLSDRGVY